ncbi:MAG: hypothetical protein M3P22_02735 [bacterium]|nr:hypothetical protein [bacterium]
MDKQEIQNLIKELIEKTNVSVINISLNPELGSMFYAVEVSEPHFFVSNDGEALHSLNHLVRRIMDSKNTPLNEEHTNSQIVIDINGFQKKHIDSIKAVAHMMAERARYFKSNIEVDPMNAYDRRIVHEFLSDQTDLKTESDGYGPTRRVVIKYTGSI